MTQEEVLEIIMKKLRIKADVYPFQNKVTISLMLKADGYKDDVTIDTVDLYADDFKMMSGDNV